MSKSWYERRLGTQPAPRAPYQAPTQRVETRPLIQETQSSPADDGMSVVGAENAQAAAFSPRMLNGLEGTRAEKSTGNCPECGSNLFFATHGRSEMGPQGMARPSRRCFSCNFNDNGMDLRAM